MEKDQPHETSLDDVMNAIAEEFGKVYQRFDHVDQRLEGLDERMMRIEQRVNVIADQIELTRADMRDAKRTASQIVHNQAENDQELIEHDHRIGRIEKKIGIAP